jgi:hypothetical protein
VKQRVPSRRWASALRGQCEGDLCPVPLDLGPTPSADLRLCTLGCLCLCPPRAPKRSRRDPLSPFSHKTEIRPRSVFLESGIDDAGCQREGCRAFEAQDGIRKTVSCHYAGEKPRPSFVISAATAPTGGAAGRTTGV